MLGEHWVGQPWCSWFALGSGCPSAAASPCASSGFGGSALPNAVSLAQGYVEIRQSEKIVFQTRDRRPNLWTAQIFHYVFGKYLEAPKPLTPSVSIASNVRLGWLREAVK